MTLPLLSELFIFAGGVGVLMLVLILALSVFWLWMLVDAISSNLPPTEKLIWVLVILFTHVLGAVLYFLIARNGARGGVST